MSILDCSTIEPFFLLAELSRYPLNPFRCSSVFVLDLNHKLQTHCGVIAGGSGATIGFFSEQPAMYPRIVSSSAASNAAPQFGSLTMVRNFERDFRSRGSFSRDNGERLT